MTDTVRINKLELYLSCGGVISEGRGEYGELWEAGRNLGLSYCVDGQGYTLRDCVDEVSEGVWEELKEQRRGELLEAVAACQDDAEKKESF